LHFEKKLWRELGEPEKVLHPFSGMVEIGDRVDINPEVAPTWLGDAHNMNWIKENTYDLVVLDPPYDDEQSKKLYGTKKLSYKKYIAEAVRVCKKGGFIAMYHWVMTPRPDGTKYYERIVILTRVWHRPRVCCVFQKE
jgi:ubiquinone/menaquinone biosynthesis C-methylase UbiE